MNKKVINLQPYIALKRSEDILDEVFSVLKNIRKISPKTDNALRQLGENISYIKKEAKKE